MALPSALQLAIDRMMESLGSYQLTEAREELTERYRFRSPSHRQLMATDKQRQAYIVARLPATYAAIQATLKAVQKRKTFPIKSVLDLGAGPGTALWVVCEQFPEIEKITLIEKDAAIARLGQQLAQASEHPAIRSADWQTADLEQLSTLPPHDLILLSYSIGEINPHKILPLMDVCWQAAQQLLVVIEPGTPVGFEHIRFIRQQFIEWGAHLVAPCPHQLACPMTQGDWCHFAARVERSSLHRRLKGGSLGHEDEKFSYVAASKTQSPLPSSRVLRRPLHHSGHVVLTLCTPEGVQQPTLSKKRGELYKQARKVEWGDTFPYLP
jgi:ribosomal protein RSM22 (predicted rRNA methylase)